MKLTAYWKHFLGQVNLNQSRIDQLDDRVTAITSFLQGANGFGADAEDVIPQGSYAQKTIIKPVGAHEFDADALLQMTEQDGWEPRDYVAELYRTFRGSSTYKELVGRRTRCGVVNYANEFHVDVVPYLIRDDGRWITNRSENKLENTNPEGFNDWLDARDRITSRRLVEVIRVMKYLRDFKQTFSARSVVLSFLLAEQGRFLGAGALAGLAMLTRPVGIALLPALALLAWRRPRRGRSLAELAISLPIAALYPLLLGIWIGEPFAFLRAQEGIWERSLSWAGPFGGLWQGFAAIWNTVPARDLALNIQQLAFTLLFLVLSGVAWRRLGAPYGLFALLSLSIPLSFPAERMPLLSMSRFGLVVFPLVLALSVLGSRRRAHEAIVAISSVLLGVAVVQWALWQWVA